jgi:uncharacterized protein YdeI (YjbR/CyaY-like superfamily)
MAVSELPILSFESAAAFEDWLAKNYAEPAGLWVKIAKKASGIPSVTHDEALDIALCYGWIDGQRKSFDDRYFIQKFTRRRPRSLWSKRNVDKVATLEAAGRMQPSGIAEVDAAKQDGRWDLAYASQQNMVFPEDFMLELQKNKKAYEYFGTLSKTNIYIIAFRLTTAKTPETRQRRFDTMLAMLERGEFK